MLEKLTFVNHLNESIEFGSGALYLNVNELHSYRWAYNSKNNKISSFQREMKEKKLPIVVVPPNSRSEGNTIMNKLMEMADKDVMSMKAGKLYCGDYYLECYLFANEKAKYDLRLGVFYSTLTVISDQNKSAWIKETQQSFDNTGGEAEFLDYDYDFSYDFTSPSLIRVLRNLGFAEADFKMVIYGEVTDPSIYIGGHLYNVTGHVADNEYLEIDSREKTITLVQTDGTRVNWFRYRNKDHYIFQKVPAGESSVIWVGDYTFTITLFEERSEPKWT